MRKTSSQNTNSTPNLDSEDFQKRRCQRILKFRRIFWGWDFRIWVAWVILWELYSLKYFFLKYKICYLLCNDYIPTLRCTEFESVFYHTVLSSMYWFAIACHWREGEQEQLGHRLRFQLYTFSKAGVFRSVLSFWKTHQCCWWGSCEAGVKNPSKVSVCPRKILILGANQERFMFSRWNQVMLKFSWGFKTRWNMLFILGFSFELHVWTPKNVCVFWRVQIANRWQRDKCLTALLSCKCLA